MAACKYLSPKEKNDQWILQGDTISLLKWSLDCPIASTLDISVLESYNFGDFKIILIAKQIKLYCSSMISIGQIQTLPEHKFLFPGKMHVY